MKVRPLHDRVLIRRAKAEEKTAGGIIIPDAAQEKPIEGEVLAVGPGLRDVFSGRLNPLDVKVGDRVVFSKWVGSEIVVEGETLLIAKESDLTGVLES